MKIEKISISKIITNDNNPRVIRDEKFKKLVNSIKEFPKMLEIRPIVVNDDMVVLGGNMRLKACKEAGLKETYIIKAKELTEDQQKEFIIKDNVGFGEWDWDILANEWDSNNLNDWALDTIFDSNDLMQDIEEIKEFNESTNFTISCANMKEFEELQTKLNTDAQKIDYSTFLLKTAL